MKIVVLEFTADDLVALGPSAIQTIAAISASGGGSLPAVQRSATTEPIFTAQPTSAPLLLADEMPAVEMLQPPLQYPPLLPPSPVASVSDSSDDSGLAPFSSALALSPSHIQESASNSQTDFELAVARLGSFSWPSLGCLAKRVCTLSGIALGVAALGLLVVYSFSSETPPEPAVLPEEAPSEPESVDPDSNPSPDTSETPSVPTFPAIGGGDG